MAKFKKNIKYQFIYSVLYIIIFSFVILPLAFCSEEVQTITITKEDILNAKARPAPVEFTSKEIHQIEVMEKRHFPRTYPEFSDSERLKNLEYELLGKIWQFSPKEERIRKLKLASSNTALIGTAVPASMSSKRTIKRLRNNELGLRQKDSVGLIDGFLRLISPEKYELYRQHADHRFNDYEW